MVQLLPREILGREAGLLGIVATMTASAEKTPNTVDLSIVDTIETPLTVLYRQVSLIQR